MAALYADARWWAVGIGLDGEIETYDPMGSRKEAAAFVRQELHGQGRAMTGEQLAEALDMDADDTPEDFGVTPGLDFPATLCPRCGRY